MERSGRLHFGGLTMLVLTRKQGEIICIGRDVEVIVMAVRNDRVRLGIKAPEHVTVDRQEVHESKRLTQERPKATCPRCGYKRAKPNARGPDHVWCKQCGGLVPVDYDPGDGGPRYNDPVRSAIANEQQRTP